MTPENFEKSMEFGLLSPAEKEFVISFVETRDATAATRAAYPKATSQTRLRLYLLNNRRVISALNLWFGRPPLVPPTAKELAIQDLRRDIKRMRGVARVQAKRLLFQLEGFIEVKR